MRILFSGPPDFGHTLPLLPLAQAARHAGHDVAILTHTSMSQVVSPLRVLTTEPPFGALRAETVRRLMGPAAAGTAPPMRNVNTGLTPAMLAELFVRVRVDLSGDEALARGRDFGPDLVVADELDALGPLIAADLKVPWATHSFGLAPGLPFLEGRDEAITERLAARGLVPTPRLAYLDMWPDLLQPDDWTPSTDRITIQHRPFHQDGVPWSVPGFPGREGLPLVLVTLGTTANDPDVLRAIVDSLATADVNVVATLGTQDKADAFETDRTRVCVVGFVPLAQLLEGVSLVVSAAGAGTLLSPLSRGLPAVLLPAVAEQPLNAERAAAAGAAAVVTKPEEIGEAVRRVLADTSYLSAARKAAEQIRHMNAPQQALDLLLERWNRGKTGG